MTEENKILTYKELESGTTLCGGKYIIENKIGEGGFGITYLALQSGLNRRVCIKEYFLSGKCVRATHARTVLVQGESEGIFEKYRQSFVREAKMLAGLHHPNIVEVLDVFDENNTSYMVMNYIEGRSILDIVNSRGRLPYPEVVNYIAQISNAIGYIHDRHILHRDIKPDNIMITADYKAILIDFGSARDFEQDKTQVQTSILTPGYAPPEQYTAKSRKGSYTDIYAIGATMYFMLTGQPPLESASRLTEQMTSPKELVPEIPEEANRTILKAMQLKAENRHQTIQDFMDDLRNVRPSVLVDETIGGKTTNRIPWPVFAIAGGIIAILIGFLVFPSKEEVPVDTKPVEYKTYDFIGGNVYPMIKVDGGSFVMGSNDIDDDDCPPHKVTLSDFYIGQFEVSQGLWEKIMGDNPSDYIPEDDYKSYPVENVGFEEVMEFIARLNKKTGKRFSLPTEAQWEFAARGGTKSNNTFFSGSDYPNTVWYNNDRPFKIKFDSSINELGLYQMSGNVAEWCADYYDADFYTLSQSSTNPINMNPDAYHVIRGGSFQDSDPKSISVYYRDADCVARPDVGFRLVMN